MIRDYDLITIGEVTIDAFMKLVREGSSIYEDPEKGGICFPNGDKIEVDKYEFSLGGCAANIAVGVNRLGLKSTLCAETGDDEFSIKIRNGLASERIERLFVNQIHGASNFSVIVNYKGDRTIFVQNVTREHDFKLEDVTTDYIYLASLAKDWESPYKMALQFLEKNMETKLAFNPGMRQLREGKDVIEKVLKKTFILFINKEEAEMILTGKKTKQEDKEYITQLMKDVQKKGPKLIVLTNGEDGSYVLDEKGKVYSEGINEGKIVERTGAGDAYTSAFLAAIMYGKSIPTAMEWGMVNATSVVGAVGAQKGLLRKNELEEKLATL